MYIFDNAEVVGDPGARFENLVATHLLKRTQFLEDRGRFPLRTRSFRSASLGREKANS